VPEEKLPYNPDAEVAVLGSILIDNDKFDKVLELISDEDFYDERNKWAFRAMMFLHKAGSEIDLLTLSDFLKDQGYLDTVGVNYLSSMSNAVPMSSRVLTYAKIVADDSAKRKIKKAAEIIGKASEDSLSLEETLKKVQDQIHEVNKVGGKQNKYQVSSMLDFADAAEERYKHWNEMHGLSTGFPSIDKLTLGLAPAELIVIAGPTSKGKTLLSMNIAANVARNGGRVLFVTLEMTHEELTSRYMFAAGGRDTNDFCTIAANTIFQENDRLNWRDIDGLIANAKEELDVDLVVIDHLHYFARGLKNSAEELGEVTMAFKDNAKKYKIPIILISHIRKLQKDEELSGDSLRGSSLIAQDSDIVLMVNRDPETNQMGVLIDKNRNRGKLSDRTKDWGGSTEREINTIYLDFNNTKLHDPESLTQPIQSIFPGAEIMK
jgi:replicative DNA helicase